MLIALSDVFLFDEPTAGMSIDKSPCSRSHPGDQGDQSKTVLLVEHKMDVVRSLADRIIVFITEPCLLTEIRRLLWNRRLCTRHISVCRFRKPQRSTGRPRERHECTPSHTRQGRNPDRAISHSAWCRSRRAGGAGDDASWSQWCRKDNYRAHYQPYGAQAVEPSSSAVAKSPRTSRQPSRARRRLRSRVWASLVI